MHPGHERGPYQDEEHDRRFDEERGHHRYERDRHIAGSSADIPRDPEREPDVRRNYAGVGSFERSDRERSERARDRERDRRTAYVDRPYADRLYADRERDRAYADRAYSSGYTDRFGSGAYGDRGYGDAADERDDDELGRTRLRAQLVAGGHRGKMPMNYTRSDERIRELICERLTDHDEIDPSRVEVHVKDGDVTISGGADDRRQRRLMEDVAESVAGVRDVHMTVRIRDNHAHS